jgi:cellulose synthase/poly-beta-1,6-N-acetylglucosamine synthase-like glycosyltransferase
MVVVIADNCSDRTAERAAANGAVCLERHDTAQPGKPRAIAWALTQVALDRHDAVIIIDADTTVDPGFARALSRAAPLEHKAVQAYFDVANPQDSALTRMAAVLASANFRVAYPLKRRAGVNAPLLGNGMGIGVGVLPAHGWKAFDCRAGRLSPLRPRCGDEAVQDAIVRAGVLARSELDAAPAVDRPAS